MTQPNIYIIDDPKSPWAGWRMVDQTLIDPEGHEYDQAVIRSTRLLTATQVAARTGLTPRQLSTYKIRSRAAEYYGAFPKEAEPDRWDPAEIDAYAKRRGMLTEEG